MKKLILIFTVLLYVGFPATAQIHCTVHDVCYTTPSGDTSTFITKVSLSGNNDTVGNVSIYLIASPNVWFSNVFLSDSNYSSAVITLGIDTIAFNWNGSFPYNVIGVDSTLLDITLSTTHTFEDSITLYNTSFTEYHGQPITTIKKTGFLFPVPKITLNPVDMTVCNGEQAHFNVNVDGYGLPLNYNWQQTPDTNLTWQQVQNISPFTGANTDSLIIYPANFIFNGNFFHCLIDNNYCSAVASGNAMLTVEINIMTQPTDQTVHETDTAIFAVTSSAVSAQYLWEESTDGGTTWSSNQLFPPVTTPMLTIIHPPLAWSGYLFRCIVTSTCQVDTTKSATLTVLPGSGLEELGIMKAAIYPNPMNTSAEFNPGTNEEYNLVLLDITGRTICKWSHLKSTFIITRNEIGNGIYLLIVTYLQTGRKETCKIIIQ